MKRARWFWIACLAATAWTQPKAPPGDVVLRAMQDELERARALRVVAVPYYIEYALDEAHQFTAAATLGALLNTQRSRFRLPRVQVRVGDYQLDNTNYIGSDFYAGVRYEVDRFPLDDSYPVLRHHLWLATDTAYKAALEAFSRKRALLGSISLTEQLPDFYRAAPVQMVDFAPSPEWDASLWSQRVRRLSALFLAYPKVVGSVVDYTASRGVMYLANSEGSRVRDPSSVMFVRVRAVSQAPDGMMLRDAEVLHSRDLTRPPEEADLERAVRRVAENLTALADAPFAEAYTGPVLFEEEAAAQLFAELLGRNVVALRRPVMPPGRGVPFRTSELEGRLGARILPEWMDVVDDPTQNVWRGRPLLGHYRVDMEGVVPGPVVLVDKGVLKSFLLTRQPVKGFQASNGRARLPGAFGAKAAAISNLFVRAAQGLTRAELQNKLIEMCLQRGKPYGLVVRKMDFPCSASWEEARRLLAGVGSGGTFPVSQPVLVYQVYPDGREQLVRGLRFRGLNVRSLRDIVAASEQSYAFDYLENGAPFALMGAALYAAEASVVAPAVLLDEVELVRMEEELTRPPLVPPPPLTPGAGGSDR